MAIVTFTLWALGFAACDDDLRCVELSAYAVDEARVCLQSPRAVPELQACAPYPPTRGVRIVCLVDGSGQLYVATINDSARVSGTGWRYSGGVGEQQLSALEMQRCTRISSEVGFPEPAKQCNFPKQHVMKPALSNPGLQRTEPAPSRSEPVWIEGLEEKHDPIEAENARVVAGMSRAGLRERHAAVSPRSKRAPPVHPSWLRSSAGAER